MYGIMTEDGRSYLCRTSYQSVYVLSPWDYVNLPVAVENSFEADMLLQEYTVHFNNYSLKIFKFTDEQTEYLLVRRLRGY